MVKAQIPLYIQNFKEVTDNTDLEFGASCQLPSEEHKDSII